MDNADILRKKRERRLKGGQPTMCAITITQKTEKSYPHANDCAMYLRDFDPSKTCDPKDCDCHVARITYLEGLCREMSGDPSKPSDADVEILKLRERISNLESTLNHCKCIIDDFPDLNLAEIAILRVMAENEKLKKQIAEL